MGTMDEITIERPDYEHLIYELAEAKATIKAFSVFVNASRYAIERKTCGAFFGFQVEEDDGD